jgi:UDP-galactopyranose mutase
MFEKFDLIVVGSGLFGSVTAEQASRAGYRVAVIEKRNHIGGNCYTKEDNETGILVHQYGPHIFHTSNQRVWDYINQFTTFNNYRHKCRIEVNGKQYSMPINLDTINNFFGRNLNPTQATTFLESMTLAYKNIEPANFQEQAFQLVGPELYHAFLRGYTLKQWETDPTLLPASIAKRLPVRTNYNDRYYNDTWEGIPSEGYTPIFEKMLSHENIQLFMQTDWFDVKKYAINKLVVYTGAIDQFYDYCYGDLAWRTLDFKFEKHDVSDYQGITQVNYADADIPYTRIIEHKHFHPEKTYAMDKTIIGIEYSRLATREDTVYYPVKRPIDIQLFEQYRNLSEKESNVIFGGRLGEYMYYDMHQVIGSALASWKNKIQPKLSK